MDPFTQEVIHEALISVVAEMRVTLLRTSFSSIIYEGQDFSCALADRHGRLAIQSREDFPAHVGPLNMQVPQAIAKYAGKIFPGDLILVNDPFTSGTHLNDVALISPIFWQNEIAMFACSRAHWGDVGGMTPGSLSGQTTEIFQEGIRIPILKLHNRGRPNEALYDLLFSNVRQPRDRRGDLMSQIAAAKCGTDRVLAMIERFGRDQLIGAIELILNRSEARMRQQIGRLPKGTYSFMDYLDSDGHSDQPVRVCARIKVKADSLEVDFTGSASQRPGPTNASLAVTSTAVFITMKALLDPDGHINSGAFRPFQITAPVGSLLNAAYPAPMGGFVEVLRRVESTLMGAMGQCTPDRVAGDTKGCANHLYISHLANNAVRSIHYEYPAGGTGGFNGGDGSNTVREWDTGDFSSIHSAEIVEIEHPCLVEECSLRQDSGGVGKWRGGLGLRRIIRLLGEEGRLSVLSDRNVLPPFGVNGGDAGLPNQFIVIRDGQPIKTSTLAGKVSGFRLLRNDRVIALSAGGGGFGDPRERDPELVRRDLEAGYVSAAAAGRYQLGSNARNSAVRATTLIARLDGRGVATNGTDTGLERVALSHSTATSLGLEASSIVEVFGTLGVPMRASVQVENTVPVESVVISDQVASILGCSTGDPLNLRPLMRGRDFEE